MDTSIVLRDLYKRINAKDENGSYKEKVFIDPHSEEAAAVGDASARLLSSEGKLVEATAVLKFYADPKNYEEIVPCSVGDDGGLKARVMLNKIDPV